MTSAQHPPYILRLLAAMLDGLLFAIPVLPVLLVFKDPFISSALGFLLHGYLYARFVSSGWQASPGKHMLGLYLLRTDGARLSFRDGWLRYLAFQMPVLPLYSSLSQPVVTNLCGLLLLLWFLPIFFTTTRQGLHDYLAQTQVWYRPVTAR